MRNSETASASILAQIQAARARARTAKSTEPRAKSARYGRETGRLTVLLTNEAEFSFPAKLAPDLKHATASQLAKVEVSPSGEGLMWPDIDADLSVAGILETMLGSTTLMRELGRVGGRSRSKAKASAARTNGEKGGRPRINKP